MVKIRLKQTGTKNRKTYRIIAIDESKKRDGREIEVLGHYNPLVEPAELVFDKARVEYWLSVGAQPTLSAKNLLKL